LWKCSRADSRRLSLISSSHGVAPLEAPNSSVFLCHPPVEPATRPCAPSNSMRRALQDRARAGAAKPDFPASRVAARTPRASSIARTRERWPKHHVSLARDISTAQAARPTSHRGCLPGGHVYAPVAPSSLSTREKEGSCTNRARRPPRAKAF
jgi:hypothetical protein